MEAALLGQELSPSFYISKYHYNKYKGGKKEEKCQHKVKCKK